MIAWLKSFLHRRLHGTEPERKQWREVPHVYAKPGTLLDFQYGDRCLFCLARDMYRRPYTDEKCSAVMRRAEGAA